MFKNRARAFPSRTPSAHPISAAGAVTYRTETQKRTCEPTWNADFELPIFAMATVLYLCSLCGVPCRFAMRICIHVHVHSRHVARACTRAHARARHIHAYGYAFYLPMGFSQPLVHRSIERNVCARCAEFDCGHFRPRLPYEG